MAPMRVERGLIDGHEHVLIDGLPATARAGETLEATAMRYITERARKSPTGQVRAALHGARGVRVVRVDKSGATVVESVTALETTRSPEDDIEATALDVANREAAPPEAEAVQPRQPRLPLPSRGQRGPLVVIAAALVVLLAAGAVAWRVLAGEAAGPVAMRTEAGQRVPGTPPAEWAGPVAWSTPPLLGEGGPPRVTVVGSDRVLVTTADRRVSMVRGADGATLWSAGLPDGEVHGQVVATSIDGGYVVAAHVGDRLVWWALDSGDEVGSIDLSEGAAVSFAGSAPLVGVSATEVGAIVDGALRTTTVPAGATALAAAPDGRLTLASPQGWWHVAAGEQVGQATPWPYASTTPVQLRPISACGDVLVTVVPGSTPGLATAVLYTDEAAGSVEWRAQGAIRLDSDQVTWRCSTSRSWGVLGRTLLGFDDGAVTDLGPWTTQQLASDRALGMVGAQRVITGPDIPRGVLPDAEAFPDDLVRLDSSGDRVAALVRWTVDGAPRVYTLTQGASS